MEFRPEINARAYATPQLEKRATVLIQARVDGRVPNDVPRQKELLAIVHELTRRAQAALTATHA